MIVSNQYRDYYCGDITENEVGKTVKISGWVENIRDHGGVIFVDVRDAKGVIQVVSNDDSIFSDLTKESTVTITGTVRKRDEDDYNDHIKTGTIEILVDTLELISKSLPLPFDIKSSHIVNEETRLKYRYLDLRNQKNHDTLVFRSEVLKFLRNKMDSLGFTEVQTPIISCSSPEGARDFIIPSRKFHGKFYALPQAPQIYKQLLMVSGFDKYYVDHTTALWPQAAGGIPFNACEFQSKGDAITDLTEDLAAEQKARTTYDNLLRLVKDPEVADPLRFLRAREIVHYQRFGEALRVVQENLNAKNFYIMNPEFDTGIKGNCCERNG